jgi:hypothetical protein
VIVNVTAAEVYLPLVTVTSAMPAVARSARVIVACNSVFFTYLVLQLDLFHFTTELRVKFEPVTVRVPPAPPAAVLDGESALMAGCCAQAPSAATSSANKQKMLSFVLNIVPPKPARSC